LTLEDATYRATGSELDWPPYGMTTVAATSGSLGTSQRNTIVAHRVDEIGGATLPASEVR
jgi:hypothetical protein